jgi:hypothetical protein
MTFPDAASLCAKPPLLRKHLTSVLKGIQIDSWEISQSKLVLPAAAGWFARKYTLHGGRQEGVDVVEVDNGRLRFLVLPTRGMSVLRVEAGDVRLGWDSPVTEVVHPKFINLESRGGLGWLEGFNEWMVRCGLEWAGHPGHDKFRNNVGDEFELDLTLHGKIGNTPASEVEVLVEDGPRPRIHVRGLVLERMFHGPKLSFWTDISTELGSNSLRFDDEITNYGAEEQEFQIIYHANFGPPLLEQGARLVAALGRVGSFNDRAARNVKTFSEFGAPQAGFVEQVYCLHPLAGAEGRTELLLENAGGTRGVSLAFPVQQLPYVTLWKNLAAETEGYVVGIEPGTGFPYTRRLEREAGRVPRLAANETRRFTIEVAIHSDPASVQSATQRIQNIQGKIKTTLDGRQQD